MCTFPPVKREVGQDGILRGGCQPPLSLYCAKLNSVEDLAPGSSLQCVAVWIEAHGRNLHPFPIQVQSFTMRLLFLSFLFATILPAQTYDLVIANGRVIDPETNLD